jgi:hypothetical protein
MITVSLRERARKIIPTIVIRIIPKRYPIIVDFFVLTSRNLTGISVKLSDLYRKSEIWNDRSEILPSSSESNLPKAIPKVRDELHPRLFLKQLVIERNDENANIDSLNGNVPPELPVSSISNDSQMNRSVSS